MSVTQTTNVDWSDARLTLGAVLLKAVGGQDAEQKVSLLLDGVTVDNGLRERMIESVDRLLGDQGTMNLDLTEDDLKSWRKGLMAVRAKLLSER